jgi:hypothetical protein
MVFSYCGPSRPLRTMICTNLNLHYTRKLSCMVFPIISNNHTILLNSSPFFLMITYSNEVPYIAYINDNWHWYFILEVRIPNHLIQYCLIFKCIVYINHTLWTLNNIETDFVPELSFISIKWMLLSQYRYVFCYYSVTTLCPIEY